MANKTVLYSVRLAEEDAEFLSNLKIEQAITPSEKIRALIKESREKEVSKKDFKSCVRYLNNYFLPLIENIQLKESQGDYKARCLRRVIEWLPDFSAYLIANYKLTPKDMLSFEKGILLRIFDLFKEIINLGLTREEYCYNPNYLESYIKETIEFATIITTVKNYTKEEDKNG